MSIISYKIPYTELNNMMLAYTDRGVTQDKAQFYINGYNVAGHDNTGEAIGQLVKNGWLAPPNTLGESERRVNLLNLISNSSMADVMLVRSDTHYFCLKHENNISMEFKLNSDDKLEMIYSVNYRHSNGNDLFTLYCQVPLGKEFELDESGPHVFFEFTEQCPNNLKNDLDCRTIKNRILDWLRNLFYIGHNSTPFTVKNISDAVEIPQLPFSELTDAELRHEVLQRDDEFVHPKNSFWEDEIAILDEIDETQIYNAGVAARYNEGVDIGFTIGEAKGYIKNLATER
ncbi:hypothetical protein FG465_000807 [Yersinia enterocolitica]|uniref:hypothetical protein n=1 Tax=Yersinia enterocolitica TaxID=630 RepID=UPI0029B1F726|nr:hypothetical protein [Yersinia enterocolitica]HEI6773570.1 hypothetical protein [Yersinia enterocolitica]HEI6837098.1 hypothetical protein [Yersinia enterocolitica]HEI6874915.1 hypothetical protein [Yersinia enterocolitica]HEI6914141.1 hypothetical protein [Yersinia enterocolitica]